MNSILKQDGKNLSQYQKLGVYTNLKISELRIGYIPKKSLKLLIMYVSIMNNDLMDLKQSKYHGINVNII